MTRLAKRSIRLIYEADENIFDDGRDDFKDYVSHDTI